MKLKKNVIITFFVVVFVFLIGIYLVKNKDIVYKSIISNSKEYLISFEEGTNTNECARYYEGVGTRVYSHEEVEEGYPIYVINNCADTLENYIKNTNDDVNACNVQKSYAETSISSKAIVDEYNNYCEDITGKLEFKTSVSEYNFGIIYESDQNYDKSLFEYGESKKCDDSGNPFYKGTGILGAEVTTAGKPVYLVKGCSWAVGDIVSNNSISEDFKIKVCNTEKNFVSTKYKNNMGYYEIYNNACGDLTGKLTIEEKVCNYDLSFIENNVYDVDNFTGNNCGDSDINEYFYGKTGILPADNNNKNKPIYIVDGCNWAYRDIISNEESNSCISDEFKKNVCLSERNYIENNWLNNATMVSTYNSVCSSYTEELNAEEYVNIIFRASNAYGLDCSGTDLNGNYVYATDENVCAYRVKKSDDDGDGVFSISLSNSTLLNTNDLYNVLTGKKFSGWKRTSESSCSYGNENLDISSLSTDASEITFEACFEGENVVETSDVNTTGYNIYKSCDGDYDHKIYGGLELTSTIQKSKNGTIDNIENTPTLTNTITTKKKYAVDSTGELYETQNVSGGNSFDLNGYCYVVCTETFTYTYPTIFETVKSGTYFELLSYPSVSSSLLCQEEIKYDDWENDYKDAIEDEKKDLVNKLNYEVIEGWSFNDFEKEDTTTCGCTSYDREGYCNGTYYDRYSITGTFYIYDEDSNTIKLDDTPYSYSECEDQVNLDEVKSYAKAEYDIVSSTNYIDLYDVTVNKRKALENANRVCYNTLFQTNEDNAYSSSAASPDNFYNISDVDVYFYYESDTLNNNFQFNYDSKKYYQDSLIPTNENYNDTGVRDWESENLTTWNEEYVIDYGDASSESDKDGNFNAIKTNSSIIRKVTRNYIYSNDVEEPYYSMSQTGKINTSGNGIYLGYVYPVQLTLSESRNVYFGIKADTNLDYGANKVLGTEPSNSDALNLYKCDYDVTNDIIIKEEGTEDKYKKNFYVRSISTSNVDPNDRYDNGLLGANWANEKGLALIEVIEKKSEGNNTYNPENLEYSFTLNAGTIEAIREYNTSHEYSDFLMDCNDMGGECKSEFLDGLKSGNIKGISVSNVKAEMDRKTWKYYIKGSWLMTDDINGNNNWNIISETNSTTKSANEVLGGCKKDSEKNTYDCIYREVNEGVLP